MFAAEWMDWTGLDWMLQRALWVQVIPEDRDCLSGVVTCAGVNPGGQGCARSWAPAAPAQKREDLMFNINVS